MAVITTVHQTSGKPGKPATILMGYRPETGEWDDNSVVSQILASVRIGAPLNAAAGYAKISRTSIWNWLARARKHLPDGEYDRLDVPEEHRPYVDFLNAVHNADSRYEIELLTLTYQHARDDKKFALTLLSKKYAHWGDKVQVSLDDEERVDPLEGVKDDPHVIAQLAAMAHVLENARAAAGLSHVAAEIEGSKPLAIEAHVVDDEPVDDGLGIGDDELLDLDDPDDPDGDE